MTLSEAFTQLEKLCGRIGITRDGEEIPKEFVLGIVGHRMGVEYDRLLDLLRDSSLSPAAFYAKMAPIIAEFQIEELKKRAIANIRKGQAHESLRNEELSKSEA